MGPLEVYYGTIALIVILIGLARGYSKELGSTMIILVAIFLLLFAEDRLNPLFLTIRSFLLTEETVSDDHFLSFVYQIFFVAAVFAGYSGKTISFRGNELPPPQGTFLSLFIGALNGYLIAGTLWYYQHKYEYPFSDLGWFSASLTDTALAIIAVLPQNLLPSATLWMIPIAVLLLLRVRG